MFLVAIASMPKRKPKGNPLCMKRWHKNFDLICQIDLHPKFYAKKQTYKQETSSRTFNLSLRYKSKEQ